MSNYRFQTPRKYILDNQWQTLIYDIMRTN